LEFRGWKDEVICGVLGMCELLFRNAVGTADIGEHRFLDRG